MRILDKNTFCPDCGTGMCYVKKFRDGHTNYFCGCRQSIWQEEYYETPCTNKSCALKDAELTRLREAVEELFLSRKEYADKAAGAQYGAVWARYMNAFCVLERELRRRAKEG